MHYSKVTCFALLGILVLCWHAAEGGKGGLLGGKKGGGAELLIAGLSGAGAGATALMAGFMLGQHRGHHGHHGGHKVEHVYVG